MNEDTVHGGSAWMDASKVQNKAADTTSSHCDFIKDGYNLPDRMLYLPDSKPRFLQLPSTDENHPNTVVDAVCSESTAVDASSTETLVALRRSKRARTWKPCCSIAAG